MSAPELRSVDGQHGLAVHAPSVELVHEEVATGQILAGTPTTAATTLGSIFGLEFGLWEMSAGAMSDVEAEELFVVLSGSATVRIHAANGYQAAELLLEPGTVCRLGEGMNTSWVVHEPLRKLYLAQP